MDSVSARNQFIIENYDRLYRICCTCAYRVMRRFSSVSFYDLVAYGFEGVIASVDRGDAENTSFFAYITRYCYLSTLAGAFQMIGINRRMTNTFSLSDEQLPREVLFEPSKIDQFIEMTQHNISDDEYEKLFHYMEIKWFISMLPNSLEKQILINLSNHYSVIETAKRLNIHIRKMRKLAIDIAYIYQLAFMGKPFEHLLTSYSAKPVKRICINLKNSPTKPAFYFPKSVLYRFRRKYSHSAATPVPCITHNNKREGRLG